LDPSGNEIDPRQELVDKILEYKRYKEASEKLATLEEIRMQMVQRGNLHKDLAGIGEEAGEGTEIQSITLFKLMKTFERVIRKMEDRNHKPQHVVFKYNYTMEQSKAYMLDTVKRERSMSFQKIFDPCHDKIQAIFLFLSMLELIQMQFFTLMVGEGMNNLILEWNQDAPDEDLIGNWLPANPGLN